MTYQKSKISFSLVGICFASFLQTARMQINKSKRFINVNFSIKLTFDFLEHSITSWVPSKSTNQLTIVNWFFKQFNECSAQLQAALLFVTISIGTKHTVRDMIPNLHDTNYWWCPLTDHHESLTVTITLIILTWLFFVDHHANPTKYFEEQTCLCFSE